MSAIALDRDDDYWKTSRTIAMSRGEDRTSLLLQRLRSVPLYYWSEKVLKILFSGYVRTGGADSCFDMKWSTLSMTNFTMHANFLFIR